MRALALFIVLFLSSQCDTNQTYDMLSIFPPSFSSPNSHSMRSPITCFCKSHLWQRDGMTDERWTLVCKQFSQIFSICFGFLPYMYVYPAQGPYDRTWRVTERETRTLAINHGYMRFYETFPWTCPEEIKRMCCWSNCHLFPAGLTYNNGRIKKEWYDTTWRSIKGSL